MSFLTENFGSMVFNDAAMREKLPSDTYRSLKKTISEGKDLDITVANYIVQMVLIDFRFRHKCELNETYPQCDHKRAAIDQTQEQLIAGSRY